MARRDSAAGTVMGMNPVQEWGQDFPSRLSRRERAGLERARERGFAVTSLRRSNLRNVWWEQCHLSGTPYVIVVRGYSRYAWVEATALPLGQPLSPRTVALLRLTLQQRPRQGARVRCGELHCFRTQLLLTEAEEMAAEVLRVMTDDPARQAPREDSSRRTREGISEFQPGMSGRVEQGDPRDVKGHSIVTRL